MKKRWMLLLVVLLLATTSTISTTAILAGGEDALSSGVDKLSSRVAAILGLDETVVDDAIKQARTELWDEALQAKLTAYEAKLAAMVEKGELTQEQADAKLEAFKSGSYDAAAWKMKAASKYEALQEKLAVMVAKGQLTQEQADEKLKWFLAKKVAKAKSS